MLVLRLAVRDPDRANIFKSANRAIGNVNGLLAATAEEHFWQLLGIRGYKVKHHTPRSARLGRLAAAIVALGTAFAVPLAPFMSAALAAPPGINCDDTTHICSVTTSVNYTTDFPFEAGYTYVFKSGTTTRLASGQQFDASISDGVIIEGGATVDLDGTATFNGTNNTVKAGGTLTLNEQSFNWGTLTIEGTVTLTNQLSSTGTVNVEEGGELIQTATGALASVGTLNNAGALRAQARLIFHGGVVNNSGTVTSADILINTAEFLNTGEVTSNGYFTNDSQITNNGTLSFSGTLFSNTATFTNNGHLTISGSAENQGSFTVSGSLDLGTDASPIATDRFDNRGTFTVTQAGQVTINRSYHLGNANTVSNAGELINHGQIVNQGTATNAGVVTSTGSIDNASQLVNTGTIYNKSGDLTNTGPVDNTAGHVYTRRPIEGDGSFAPSPSDPEHGILFYFAVRVDPADATQGCSAQGSAPTVPADPDGVATYVAMGGHVDLTVTCTDKSWKLKDWTLEPVATPNSGSNLGATLAGGSLPTAAVDNVTEPFIAVVHLTREAPNPGPAPLPPTGPAGPIQELALIAGLVLMLGAAAIRLAAQCRRTP
ncbi:MAG: hypothetical protein LBH68_08155 [Bifidobacteriaceae bacterium]|nr:hypothetical protein [Bifidobacteriaceae bacterium]